MHTSHTVSSAAVALLCASLAGLAGCDEGRLVMQLDLPADPRLDPTLECREGNACDRGDPRLSRLSLRISRDGQNLRTQDTAISASTELPVGEVPVDERFDLRLAGQSVTGQVLGLGVVRDVVLSAESETRLAVKFRKPISYVAGGDGLRVIDTVSANATELPAVALGGVVDVAAAPNGALVAAITDKELVRLRTSDHFAVGCDGPLPGCTDSVPLAPDHGQPAICLALSPDSSAALVCHDTGITAVSGLSTDRPQTAFFQLGKTGKPTSVVFEPAGRYAWALVNGAGRSCGDEKSVLVRIDLQTNQPTGAPIALGQPAAGLALDPIGGAPLVTLPCSGKLGRLEGGQVKAVLEGLPPLYDVAVVQQTLVLVGKADRGDPREPLAAQVISIDRSDPGRPGFPSKDQLASLGRRFELPFISVRLSNDVSPEGYLLWVSPPNDATIYDVEVSPDGQRALLLMQATYGSDMNLADICRYRTEITGISYLLVDLDSGKVLLNRFTDLQFGDCSTNCASYKGQPMAVPSVCAEALSTVLSNRGELIRPGFDARAATLLFGY